MLNPRLRAPIATGRMDSLRIALLIACCAAGLQTRNGYGDTLEVPPVDCKAPKDRLDNEICADKAMKEWWWEALYRDTLALSPERREAINSAEKEWTAMRDDCAAPDSTLACAYVLYDERTEALLDEGIRPLWLHSAANPAQALARFRTLTSPLARMYTDLLTQGRSDESITAFLTFADSLAKRFDSEVWKNGPAIVLPCDLVKKYPRLMLLTRPDLHSDKQVPRPALDCAWKPEPDPVWDFLKHNPRAFENWFERCYDSTDGKVWAHYSFVLLDRMRYFPRSYVTGRMGPIHAPEEPWPTRQEVQAWYSDPHYRNAQSALSAYYRGDFGLTPEDAETAAIRALWDDRNTMDNPAACLDAH